MPNAWKLIAINRFRMPNFHDRLYQLWGENSLQNNYVLIYMEIRRMIPKDEIDYWKSKSNVLHMPQGRIKHINKVLDYFFKSDI